MWAAFFADVATLEANSAADLALAANETGNNSCRYARDGACDAASLCATGTDCTDCGTCKTVAVRAAIEEGRANLTELQKDVTSGQTALAEFERSMSWSLGDAMLSLVTRVLSIYVLSWLLALFMELWTIGLRYTLGLVALIERRAEK